MNYRAKTVVLELLCSGLVIGALGLSFGACSSLRLPVSRLPSAATLCAGADTASSAGVYITTAILSLGSTLPEPYGSRLMAAGALLRAAMDVQQPLCARVRAGEKVEPSDLAEAVDRAATATTDLIALLRELRPSPIETFLSTGKPEAPLEPSDEYLQRTLDRMLALRVEAGKVVRK